MILSPPDVQVPSGAERTRLGTRFTLTLRQLFYQFVARDFLPNTRVGYRQVCNVMSAARDAGEIDWDAIEDRTRGVHGWRHYDDPADCITRAAWGYAEDPWVDQGHQQDSFFAGPLYGRHGRNMAHGLATIVADWGTARLINYRGSF